MVIRELDPGEVPPEAGVVPGSLVIGVVDDAGQVVSVIGAFTTVFLDPLWVREGQKAPLRKLWHTMSSRLQEAGIKTVIGHADWTQPAMSRILRRLGALEVTGKQQFVLRLED